MSPPPFPLSILPPRSSARDRRASGTLEKDWFSFGEKGPGYFVSASVGGGNLQGGGITMGIQPLQDWVLIEPSEAEEKTAGGVFIPDTAKEKPVEGKVLAVGKGRWETPEKKWGSKPKGKEEKVFKPTVLKPGDQVLYEKNGTTPVDLDGEELVLVRESDVLGWNN